MKSVSRFVLVACAIVLGVGCSTIMALSHGSDKPPDYTLRFFEEASSGTPPERTKIVVLPRTQETIRIDPYPQISEQDVLGAELQPTVGGDAILIKFDSDGGSKLMELTARMHGRYFVVMVNQRTVAAVLCDRINSTGKFLLFGDLTDEQTKGLVKSLNKTANKRRDIGDVRYEP